MSFFTAKRPLLCANGLFAVFIFPFHIATADPDHIIDAEATGTAFSSGVRGQALADVAITRGEYQVGIPRTLEVSRGSSIRGVATGLGAEIYDWRTRNNDARPPTLEFLRYSRDYEAELYIGLNMRGLVEPAPDGGHRYYDTSISTLAALAQDWVRYVNHIVPTYRQGDPINDPGDAAILNSLKWSSSVQGDQFDQLLAPDEADVPRIKYWEIGNEPTIGVSAFGVTNSFTLSPAEYRERYRAITDAVKAVDPAIKVGPTLVHAGREADHLQAVLSDPQLEVDFITYHPYERMGAKDDTTEIIRHLRRIHSTQTDFLNEIRDVVIQSGRDPDTIEYAATEVNVSYWDTNDSVKEAEMAHALGSVETVFSHARLDLHASHYWIWPSHRWDGTEYPLFKAYEKLRDHLGDTLLSTYAFRDIRLYTTRDSATGELAVWILNFANNQDFALDLAMENVFDAETVTLLRLEDQARTTTLSSSNLASDMPGGPTMDVDWTSIDWSATDLSRFELTIPAATISLLVIEPALEPPVPAYLEFDPIEPQMAGIPFPVTLRAKTESGEVAGGFSGTVVIESNGRIEEGSATPAFDEGELTEHRVNLGNTGHFQLTAREPDLEVEGVSNTFPVSTNWQNWVSLNVDPEDLEDSVRAQRLADPEGLGRPMLMRYAFDLGSEPFGPIIDKAIVEGDNSEHYLSVTFRRLQIAPDVRYVALAGDDLMRWETLEVVDPGSPEWVSVLDNQPVRGTGRRFLKVEIIGADTFRFWQTGEYGSEALNQPEISGPAADPGDYGITNLERYALGMSARDPDTSRLPVQRTVTEDGENYPELVFERLPRGEDVRYIVEAASGSSPWETIEVLLPGQPTEVVVRDPKPVSEPGERLIRLRLEGPGA